MKKLLLFLFPMLLPFLVSARAADQVVSTPERLFSAVREEMQSGRSLFSISVDFPLGEYASPNAVMDAVYRFDDTDTGNDLDDLRETIAFQSVKFSGNRCVFCFFYLSSPEETAYVGREVGQVLSTLPLVGGEAARAQAIVDWVCAHVTYDAKHRTAYDALLSGRANCVGYSVLSFKLLRAAGLDAKIVHGLDSNNVRHAWNLVKIDDMWYNLDVTWGDTGKTDRWFFRGADGFEGHDRFAAFSSERFQRLYHMAREDLDATPLSYPGK